MYVVVILACLGVAHASSDKTWGYGPTTPTAYGPADWSKGAADCAKSSQSPINIISKDSVDKDFQDLKLGFIRDTSMVRGSFANNGHSPTFSITPANTATLSGGPLIGTFKLAQLNFHFGASDKEGSEHLVNGKAYPAELHLVFYNTKYADFASAADKADGLAVVGVFLEASRSRSNTQVSRLATFYLPRIIKQGSRVPFGFLSLKMLVPQLDDDDVEYYTYKGSLTTPNCYESVRWIVLKEPIFISRDKLEVFRKLEAEHGFSGGLLRNNFRPVQPLNGRTVYHSA